MTNVRDQCGYCYKYIPCKYTAKGFFLLLRLYQSKVNAYIHTLPTKYNIVRLPKAVIRRPVQSEFGMTMTFRRREGPKCYAVYLTALEEFLSPSSPHFPATQGASMLSFDHHLPLFGPQLVQPSFRSSLGLTLCGSDAPISLTMGFHRESLAGSITVQVRRRSGLLQHV